MPATYRKWAVHSNCWRVFFLTDAHQILDVTTFFIAYLLSYLCTYQDIGYRVFLFNLGNLWPEATVSGTQTTSHSTLIQSQYVCVYVCLCVFMCVYVCVGVGGCGWVWVGVHVCAQFSP